MRYLSLLAALMLGLSVVGCDNTATNEPAPAPAPEIEPAEPAAPAEPATPEPGAAIDAAADAVAINTTCPLSGEAIAAEGKRVSYDGQVYGFCCGDCVNQFKADPAKFAKSK